MTEQSILDRARAAGCPITHFETAPTRPVGDYHRKSMEFRDGGPIWVNTLAQGFWLVSSYDLLRDLFRTPEIFTSDSITPHDPDQSATFKFIPGNVNPPEHRKYRLMINPWFSVGAVKARESEMRERARKLVTEIAPSGGGDVAGTFCMSFPTEVFLDIVGLPLEDTAKFIKWVELFFRLLSGEEAPEGEDPELATAEILEYIGAVVDDRRANPRDPSVDFFTALIGEEIDGRPLTDEELQSIGLMLVVAGLDTTRGHLARMLYHLATNPEDRRRIVEDPDLIPMAVEESLRLHTIIFGVGRKVSEDVEWNGVELKKGDMVMALNSSANRDPRVYEDPDTYKMDREIKHHLGFADGPHRCLGMFLAKVEMRIAMEEWHKVIPDYELEPGVELGERGAGLSLNALPLVWPKPD